MRARPVFIYGTLRPGEANHHLVADAACTAPAWLADHALHGHGLVFPYITAQPGAWVRGDVVWPAEGSQGELLTRLDQLEGFVATGHPANHYDRVARPCRLDTGQQVDAWVYLAGPDARARLATGPDRTIASGDWHDADAAGFWRH
ncbi:MAG: hypothetical protein BRC31_07070 [Actinobacteria bacterium QS_5_72_10]|nr:MAG: hypothetical protein BRC31_07070 [Actinobacteria bacterium QS_5_72_10]